MKKIFLLIFFLVNAAATSELSFAEREDLRFIVKSQYFSIYAQKGVDIDQVLKVLNYDYFLQLESLLQVLPPNVRNILVKTIDAIYLETSDILGVNIFTFEGTIRIYKDKAAMHNHLLEKFGAPAKAPAYFSYDDNTIYLAMEDLTLGIFSHEMAHAIITHYFGIPPPVKMQEVLSGYVEYNLRKSTGTLP
ncbi:MAG: hypothetical protein KAR05_07415 [Candidatus Omnitrophica bacterium]|nr:hypothetical protein [Candidatus Omnitrophota bacterium]